MKRALVIRNVSSHDVPLDNLDNACVQSCTAHGFITELAINDEADVMHQLMQTHARSSASNDRHVAYHSTTSYGSSSVSFDAVILRASGLSECRLYPLLRIIRTISKQIFLCVFSPQLSEHPMGRYQCFQEGASMVTESLDDVRKVLAFVASCGVESSQDSYSRRKNRGRSGGRDGFTCPFCGMNGMDEDQLWRHCPLYHINEKNTDGVTCPICRETPRGPFQVHMHNAHGPPGRHEMASEFHMADSTLYSFALVVCYNKKHNSFLLVQEFANSGFWLPGGRIDCGENPAEAAIRETKEEAGIDIRLTGLLKLEYHPKRDRNGSQYVRMRFVFYAEPLDCDQSPKSIPDYESAGATWCRIDQVASLPLRGSEPVTFFNHIASGKAVYPLDLVQMTSS
ncbi:unnamed protein product [Peronospora destructor]|uniref:Nudix hydrolase domain-containing protein n=1 Tax=Peronospora destructor TaxID=86335 RepID=A0AAV0VA94_9STRA|nr:unnamed protein product [Peronospora destructor]